MFKKDLERTPQERARRAQLSVLARLGGCGYLIYLMVQLLSQKAGVTTTMTVLAYILMAAAVVVTGITVYDLFSGLKTGRFNPAMYEEADALRAASEEAPRAGGEALNEHRDDDGDSGEDGKEDVSNGDGDGTQN